MPKAGLPLAVPAQLVAGFAEAAVEAQVVSDGVLPAVRSRLKEGEVLSGKEHKGAHFDSHRKSPSCLSHPPDLTPLSEKP